MAYFPKGGPMANHKITLDLTTDEAAALAQLLKRITYTAYRQHAVSDDEAYLMKDAGDVLTKALREVGFDPR